MFEIKSCKTLVNLRAGAPVMEAWKFNQPI